MRGNREKYVRPETFISLIVLYGLPSSSKFQVALSGAGETALMYIINIIILTFTQFI